MDVPDHLLPSPRRWTYWWSWKKTRTPAPRALMNGKRRAFAQDDEVLDDDVLGRPAASSFCAGMRNRLLNEFLPRSLC